MPPTAPESSSSASPPAPPSGRYDVGVVLDDTTAQGLAVRLVGHARAVLEVGPAGGVVTGALIANGCTVTCVEPDAASTDALRATGAEVIVDTAEAAFAPEGPLDSRHFDVIVLGDVLEHLVDPVAVLVAARRFLSPQGWFVISVPNVAHIDVRLGLLKGEFRYTETGLLDRTHLRFFTRDSIRETLERAGLDVVQVERTFAPAFCSELGLDPEDFAPELVAELRDEPEAETYQFVLLAAPTSADRLTTAALREHAQLLFDLHTAQVLTERAEAATARAEHRTAELTQRCHDLEERIGRLEAGFVDPARKARLDKVEAVWESGPFALVRRARGAMRR